MRATIPGSILLISLISTAHADWQYTKWGMSPEQVAKSSKGRAVPYTSKYNNASSQQLLSAPYSSGPFTFQARFEFKTGEGLSLVSLHADNPSECAAIQDTLVSKYGASEPEARRFGDYKWFDKKSNNIVASLSLPNDCIIVYRPFGKKGGGEGL